MAHLIDKDALVAEIEKRKSYFSQCGYPGMGQYEQGNKQGHLDTCDDIISILNTLEVKEVDLENSVKGRIDYPLIGVDFPNIYPNYKELKDYCDKNGIKDEDKVKILIIKD